MAALVIVGTLVLLIEYPNIPEEVVLYRAPWGTFRSDKSWLTVGRIAVMAAGQLGAATAFAVVALGSIFWRRFWCSWALVAGVKTLLECCTRVAAGGYMRCF